MRSRPVMSREQQAIVLAIDATRQAPATPIDGAVEGGIVTAVGYTAFRSIDVDDPYYGSLDPSNTYYLGPGVAR